MVTKIVNLHATWCGPCKKFESVFKLASEDEKNKGITFERFDIESDEGADLVEKHNVRSVPTTIIFGENDDVLAKLSGTLSIDEFQSVIDDYAKE